MLSKKFIQIEVHSLLLLISLVDQIEFSLLNNKFYYLAHWIYYSHLLLLFLLLFFVINFSQQVIYELIQIKKEKEN